MPSYPYQLIIGNGLGTSYSSLQQVGKVLPATGFGQAKIELSLNLKTNNVILHDHCRHFPELSGEVTMYFIFNRNTSQASDCWRLAHPEIKTLPASSSNPLVFVEEDGHETTYQFDKNSNTYVAPGLANGTPFFYYNKDSEFWVRYHPGTGLNELFNSNGQLIRRQDQYGNSHQYFYDGSNRLTEIHSPSGSQSKFVYSGSVSSGNYKVDFYMTPSQGQQTWQQSCYFDKLKRLTKSVIAASTRLAPDNTTKYTTTYQYFSNDYSNSSNPGNCNLMTVTQDDGSTLRLTYGSNKVSSLMVGTGGQGVRFQYQSQQVSVQIGDGTKLDVLYNSAGQITQINRYQGYQAIKGTDSTAYTYHPSGQLATITSPDNSQETFSYDNAYGLKTKHIRPDGQVTQWFYETNTQRPQLVSQVKQLDSNTAAITRYVNEHQTHNSSAPEEETIVCRYLLSPLGKVTAIDSYPNGTVKSRRQYRATAYEISSLKAEEAPTVTTMSSWVKDKIQATLYSEYLLIDAVSCHKSLNTPNSMSWVKVSLPPLSHARGLIGTITGKSSVKPLKLTALLANH